MKLRDVETGEIFEGPDGDVPDGYELVQDDPVQFPDWAEAGEQARYEPSRTEAFLRGAGQGATLGWQDEGSAALEHLLHKLTGSDRFDTYEKARDYYRGLNNKSSAAHPAYYTGGNIAGGLPLAVAAPGGLVGNVAAGAASGLGSSDADNARGLVQDTLVGAGLGAAATGVAKLAPKVAEKVLGAGGKFTKKYIGRKISGVLDAADNDAAALPRKRLGERLKREVLEPLQENEFASDAEVKAVRKLIRRVEKPKRAGVKSSPDDIANPVAPKNVAELTPEEIAAREAAALAQAAKVEALARKLGHYTDDMEAQALPGTPTSGRGGNTVSMRAPDATPPMGTPATQLENAMPAVPTPAQAADTVIPPPKRPPSLSPQEIAILKRRAQGKANYNKDPAPVLGDDTKKVIAAILREEEEAAVGRGAPELLPEFQRLKRIQGSAIEGARKSKRALKADMFSPRRLLASTLGGTAMGFAGGPMSSPLGIAAGSAAAKYGPTAGNALMYGLGLGLENTKGAAPALSRSTLTAPYLLELLGYEEPDENP